MPLLGFYGVRGGLAIKTLVSQTFVLRNYSWKPDYRGVNNIGNYSGPCITKPPKLTSDTLYRA